MQEMHECTVCCLFVCVCLSLKKMSVNVQYVQKIPDIVSYGD